MVQLVSSDATLIIQREILSSHNSFFVPSEQDSQQVITEILSKSLSPLKRIHELSMITLQKHENAIYTLNCLDYVKVFAYYLIDRLNWELLILWSPF